MQSRMTTDLALPALLSAVWRRKPKTKVMIHSDQGSQFSSKEWQSFLGKPNLDASMSRRGNCHNNAVAESFFQLLKRERIRRRTYVTCNAARQDVFDYIEMFYNPNRKHTNNGMLPQVDYEIKQPKTNEAGVWQTRGTSNAVKVDTEIGRLIHSSDTMAHSMKILRSIPGIGAV
jgi:putative transposase